MRWLIVIIILLLAGCQSPPKTVYEEHPEIYKVVIRHLYHKCAHEQYIAEVQKMLEE